MEKPIKTRRKSCKIVNRFVDISSPKAVVAKADAAMVKLKMTVTADTVTVIAKSSEEEELDFLDEL